MKAPEASIDPTYKFALLKYLMESDDKEEADRLASELSQQLNLRSSPVLLRNFARITGQLRPSVAKKALDLCLQHPEIPDEEKRILMKEMGESKSDFEPKSTPLERDEDLSVEPA